VSAENHPARAYDSFVALPGKSWNLRSAVTAFAIVIAVGASVLPAADTAHLWIGIWRLDLEKSDFGSSPPAFKRATCTIEEWRDGLKVSYDLVGIRGGITHTEWIGRFDGHDYRVQGADAALTNAYTQVDDRTYDIVTKVEGRVQGNARVSISPDGQTMTTRTTIRNPQKGDIQSTTVYRKRTARPN
jgi:hypothetical protein